MNSKSANKLKVLIRLYKPRLFKEDTAKATNAENEKDDEMIDYLKMRRTRILSESRANNDEDDFDEKNFLLFRKKKRPHQDDCNCTPDKNKLEACKISEEKKNDKERKQKSFAQEIMLRDFKRIYSSQKLGDSEKQKKCFNRSDNTANNGYTLSLDGSEKETSGSSRLLFQCKNRFITQKSNLLNSELGLQDNANINNDDSYWPINYTHIIEIGEGVMVGEYEGDIEKETNEDIFNAIVTYNSDQNEDSTNDSEDSNASSFFLNSYCDEPDSTSESSSTECGHSDDSCDDVESLDYDMRSNKMCPFSKKRAKTVVNEINEKEFNYMDDVFAAVDYNEESIAKVYALQNRNTGKLTPEANNNNSIKSQHLYLDAPTNNNNNDNENENEEQLAKQQQEKDNKEEAEEVQDPFEFLKNMTEEERAEQYVLMGLEDYM